MKKTILLMLYLCIAITTNAKTRYVAFNDIIMKIETYDSLNNPTHEYLNTHESYLIKNVDDFQITAYSVPVSDAENKAIKKAKNAQGWAMAAMIASTASTVMSAVSTTRHHHHYWHRHSWWHPHDQLLLSHMNFMFSADLYRNATKALSELQNFEGTAVIISNNAMTVKPVFVNGLQYFIPPKDTKAFNISKDNTVIVIQEHNKVTKLTVQAIRIVKKISYNFDDNEFYYIKTHGTHGQQRFQQFPKTNMYEPRYIDEIQYQQYKTYSKTIPKK